MNIHNRIDLIIAVVFTMSPQLGGLGPKSQYLVISHRLSEGETLQKFHLRVLQAQSKFILSKYETGQINNLTGKYTMEIQN